MALSCFTLFVPVQLHNHFMVWTPGQMPQSCVPWGWCPLGQSLNDSLGWGAAWLCPPDHPAVPLRLILALVGFHHCSADFELLKAVFVHLPFGQEEEDDARWQSNGPAE